jgi:twitching motility protein PilT
MADSNAVPLLGRIAVHLKMITLDQLAEVTRAQGRAGEDLPLGELLVARGLIDRQALSTLLMAQRQVLAKQKAARQGAAPARPAPCAPEPTAPPAREAVREQPAVENQPPSAVALARAIPAPPPAAGTAGPAEVAAGSASHPIVRLEDLAVPGDEDREAMFALLRQGVEQGASDIHLHSGAAALLRVAGNMSEVPGGAVPPERVERMALSILEPAQRAVLAQRGEIDLCASLAGIGRFRANFYRQQRGFDGVLRRIAETPPSLTQLGLPLRLAKFTTYHQGMVLVTGPTGCGKSSTLAALVDLINEERAEHILTIEDPIEYLHASKRCLVNQRSVHRHTQSFARALRAALREDPDVIVIGELRDLETISLALTAAETGHFVLATLHTENAIRTVNRLIGSFPADQQEQIRTMISESLRAVISQRLVPRADGTGRVPAIETLIGTKAVGNLIRENKTFQIHSILQTGSSQGMTLLDHSLRALVKDGSVSREAALRFCEDPKSLAA